MGLCVKLRFRIFVGLLKSFSIQRINADLIINKNWAGAPFSEKLSYTDF